MVGFWPWFHPITWISKLLCFGFQQCVHQTWVCLPSGRQRWRSNSGEMFFHWNFLRCFPIGFQISLDFEWPWQVICVIWTAVSHSAASSDGAAPEISNANSTWKSRAWALGLGVPHVKIKPVWELLQMCKCTSMHMIILYKSILICKHTCRIHVCKTHDQVSFS